MEAPTEIDPTIKALKPMVIMIGDVTEVESLINHLSDEQLKLLITIIKNPKHPWMIEHKQRLQNFEKGNRKEERRKRLKIKTKEIFWNRKSSFQKFLWFLPRISICILLGIPIVYAAVGIAVELLFDYTINLF